MTDSYSCKIDGCDYAGSPTGLRSHISGSTDDDHQEASEEAAWKEWYPAAYGVDEQGSTDGTPDDPPSEPASEAVKVEDGDDTDDPADDPESTPSHPPSKAASTQGSDRDDYAEQWNEGDNDPSDPPSKEGEPSDGDGSDDPGSTSSDPASKQGGKGTSRQGTRRLATLAAPLVALILLLVRGDPDDQGDDVVDAGDATSEQPEASNSSADRFSTIQ